MHGRAGDIFCLSASFRCAYDRPML